MRMKLAGLVLIGLMLSAARHAAAYRLIYVPTGQVLSLGQVRVEYKRLEYVDDNLYRVDAGLPMGLELQAAWNDLRRGEDPSIGGQLRLLPETVATPAVSVGVQDVGVSSRGKTTAYLVAGKALPLTLATGGLFRQELRLHAGVGLGLLKGLFAGADLTLSPAFRVYVEHDSRSVNGGVAWTPLRRLSVKLEEVHGQPAYGLTLSVGL